MHPVTLQLLQSSQLLEDRVSTAGAVIQKPGESEMKDWNLWTPERRSAWEKEAGAKPARRRP